MTWEWSGREPRCRPVSPRSRYSSEYHEASPPSCWSRISPSEDSAVRFVTPRLTVETAAPAPRRKPKMLRVELFLAARAAK